MDATKDVGGEKVGKVSRARYEELVADGLEQLALAGAAQLRLPHTYARQDSVLLCPGETAKVRD